jgi:type IV secretory pathway VirB2 component (pilin)
MRNFITAVDTARCYTQRYSHVAKQIAVGVGLVPIVATTAFASTGAPMPWDTALQNLLANLSGPTAQALVLIAIVACGLLWAFTRNEEGLKRLGQIAFGGAIALGSVALLANLGFAGALL